MTIEERLKEIEALCERATLPPWVQWKHHGVVVSGKVTGNTSVGLSGVYSVVCECDEENNGNYLNDAAFIAEARQTVPMLVAALREAVSALKEQYEVDDREKIQNALERINAILAGEGK